MESRFICVPSPDFIQNGCELDKARVKEISRYLTKDWDDTLEVITYITQSFVKCQEICTQTPLSLAKRHEVAIG